MTRRIAIDIETSGLNPEAGFEVIKICAVELVGASQFGANFHSLVKPSHPLLPLAEEITGIANNMLVNAPSFSEIVIPFLNFIAEAKLICINAAFDRAFLNNALDDLNLPGLPSKNFFDLQSKIPSDFRKQGSDALYNYASIRRNPSAQPSKEVARLYWALFGRDLIAV